MDICGVCQSSIRLQALCRAHLGIHTVHLLHRWAGESRFFDLPVLHLLLPPLLSPAPLHYVYHSILHLSTHTCRERRRDRGREKWGGEREGEWVVTHNCACVCAWDCLFVCVCVCVDRTWFSVLCWSWVFAVSLETRQDQTTVCK